MEQQPESATASSDTCDIGHRSREEDNIIDSMDNDTTILRQRRVAFYNNWSNDNQGMLLYNIWLGNDFVVYLLNYLLIFIYNSSDEYYAKK